MYEVTRPGKGNKPLFWPSSVKRMHNNGQRPSCKKDEALRTTDLTKAFAELLIFQLFLIWISIGKSPW